MQPLIKRVALNNYKSIASCDVSLGPLNFLAGPNASGKSNFLDALRFISGALGRGLDWALEVRGDFYETLYRGAQSRSFSLRVEVEDGLSQGHYDLEIASDKNKNVLIKREKCLYGDRNGQFSYEMRDGKLVKASDNLPLPSAVAMDGLLLPLAGNLPGFRTIYHTLKGARFYNPVPQAIMSGEIGGGHFLDSAGRNTASVFAQFGDETKKVINQYLDGIASGIDARITGEGPTGQLEFFQSVKGQDPWQFPARSASQGTLRALGVLVALFQEKRGRGGILSIEEPETAIHPAALSVLLEAMREASEHSQIICTSHSPDILDDKSISPEEIRAVAFDGGKTIIDELDDASAETLRKQLTTAGDLLRAGQLRPREKLGEPQILPL